MFPGQGKWASGICGHYDSDSVSSIEGESWKFVTLKIFQSRRDTLTDFNLLLWFCTKFVGVRGEPVNVKAMNLNFKSNGLSARRWAIGKTREIISAAIRLVRGGLCLALLTGMLLTFSSCDKKTNGQDSAEASKMQKDSSDMPKVNIRVNRHYDDRGNLVGFDSTYSSFYSNVKGDTGKMDSLMENFDRYFNRNHSSFFDSRFDALFFKDTTRYPDFFHNDYFMKRYELNDPYLRGMMREMDSIKNHYFIDRRRQPRDAKQL